MGLGVGLGLARMARLAWLPRRARLAWLLRSRARPVTRLTRLATLLLSDTILWCHWHGGNAVQATGKNKFCFLSQNGDGCETVDCLLSLPLQKWPQEGPQK